ncbi:DUF1120 domain-containing protein [Pseudomonas sp. 681]|uniref:DUF1120 domain-containing protein n=1 Tax=Pseudomonas fungipugnans TaxID=3024217 RepID=A0ABT6QT51_9PSED|nr:DUF1120 domain-containing protein [Pseudomonas sp. 681]MDI2593916.1 DUF1120 domain-containing protein [Pseudomonas sp. 681]
MNKMLSAIAPVLLLGSALGAHAASTVDLAVKGLVTPSSCTPSLTSGGVVDYGKMSSKDLRPDRATSLANVNLQLAVTCEGSTLLALQGNDNREGSDHRNDLQYYGLGLINGGEKLGAFDLRFSSPVADGITVHTIASPNGGGSWWAEPNLVRGDILSVAHIGSLVPIPVRNLTADVRIGAEIAPTRQLTLDNEVPLDGSATITVKYL